MQLASSIRRPQLVQARRKSASRQAKKLTGAKKRVQVILPNGKLEEWQVTNARDVEECLNVRNLNGGTLLNKSTEPPELIANFEKVEDGQVYHALAPGHSSPFTRINVTLHLPLDKGHRYIKRIFPLLTQAILTRLLATYYWDGVRTADQPKEVAMTNITSLEDGGEYFGVPTSAEIWVPRSTVKRLERVDNKMEVANEDAVRERLYHLATQENPGAIVTSMCRKAYSKYGEQVIEVDAAVMVSFKDDQPPIAYVAECKRTMMLTAFGDVMRKWVLIKGYRDTVPELQEDYGGVQVAKLYVAADVLATYLTLEQVVEMSHQHNIGVLMRNGMEYNDLKNSCSPKP